MSAHFIGKNFGEKLTRQSLDSETTRLYWYFTCVRRTDHFANVFNVNAINDMIYFS